MWSPFALCLLVGLTYARSNPAWKEGTEYEYMVQGRTLASLHEVSNQYSGILYKAKLKIQPRNDGQLQAQIIDAQYSQIHSELHGGWDTYIPEAELSWNPVGLSSMPFQIEMKQGRISGLIVNKDIANWEANIIKGVVSQFQMNTNRIGSDREKLDSRGNSAVFEIMEDTVTGNVETVYSIKPLPEHILQSNSWYQSLLNKKGDGDVIEVIKHKNYNNSIELPSYFYGFGGLETGYPATNQMGYFFVRNSITRALLTGSLNRYTIQRVVTVNENQVSPTLGNKKKGSVISTLNVTLVLNHSVGEPIKDVTNPVRLRNLVYSYEKHLQHKVYEKQAYNTQNIYGDRYQRGTNMMKRLRRSFYQDDEYYYQGSEESYKHQHPKIQDAPNSPLLPYTMGFKGMPIKKTVNIVKSVVQLANEIGDDLQDPDKVYLHNTLNKFTTLSALLKNMNSEEIQRASSEIYCSEEGSKRDAWKAFRDSVAQCGTGPAFLAIQQWILSGKIQGVEASTVLGTMSNAVREPTLPLMKSFFELVVNQKVQAKWPLNDTALLSYSKLVRKVYVLVKKTREHYPIKSFVNFNNQEGIKYMLEVVIPYYSQQLHDAISQGQTHKIHVFIRCLGNIGHPNILSAYEPYLEGKKQASQYQRVLMVLGMDKLVGDFPEEARSVLFNLYQNTGESQEVRVAAVYQLMRTYPPVEVLQYMASYTNMDMDEHVNAAVKFSIEAAAKLGDPELQSWRWTAETVQHLLTKKTYGAQHGGNYIRNRFVEELKIWDKESIEFFGSEDSFIPKGFKYSLRTNVGGANQRLVNIQTMISSFDELIHVFKNQTEYYSKQYKEQGDAYNQQKQNPYSSQKIAGMLKLEPEELEQLEASWYMELGDFYGMWSFDNMTMNELPERIRKIEEEMKQGKPVNILKFVNHREMSLAVPMESGIPFLFTYDAPIVMKIQGSVKASSKPQISQQDKLYAPESLQFSSNLDVTFSSTIQGRVSFIVPYECQQYIAGFDKKIHMHAPVQASIDFDVKKMQAMIEIEPMLSQQKTNVHYSTWPFTARVDIKNLQPVLLQSNTHVIKPKHLSGSDKIWGKESTGLAIRIQSEPVIHFSDFVFLQRMFKQFGLCAAIMGFSEDVNIRYSQYNINILPEQSSTRKIAVNLGYLRDYKQRADSKVVFTYCQNSRDRLQEIVDIVSSGKNNVATDAVDAEILFEGDENIKYVATAGFAKSNVDPKSRFEVYAWKSADRSESKPMAMFFKLENVIPNTNGLDLEYAMQHEPQADSTIEFQYGPTINRPTDIIKGSLRFSRSDERKQYLRQLPLYQQCKYEMNNGDKQSPACVSTIMAANLLDRINMNFHMERVGPELEQVLKTGFHALRYHYFPFVHVDTNKKTSPKEINVKVNFHPDLRAVNVSVATKEALSYFRNIEVDEYAKELFVVHPVFHVPSRLISKVLELPYYRPFSVVDKTQISTYNNRTYPVHLSENWAVMFQYLPNEARHFDGPNTVEDQLRYQPEQYVVLVSQTSKNSQNKKVKIVLSSPETDYKVIEIDLKPSSPGKYPLVTFSGKEVNINDKNSYDYNQDYIQIYGLPNKEVKVEIQKAFYVLYDGTRLRLTVARNKFRNSVRGFSGPYNDEQIEQFLTPLNCITSNSYKFLKTYEYDSQKGQEIRHEFSRPHQKECVKRTRPLYVNVISDQSARRDADPFQESSGQCTKFQTRYIEQNGEICFSIHAIPVCNSRCQPRGTITKNVPVHCIQKSNAAELWKNQIDRGANPDFSHKKESKTISMQLPQSCLE